MHEYANLIEQNPHEDNNVIGWVACITVNSLDREVGFCAEKQIVI